MLLFYFIIVYAIAAYYVMINDSCGNNEMKEIEKTMEADCFRVFNSIPYYLDKHLWFNTPTIYELC